MPTKTVHCIEVNNKNEEIEITRDGFNVYHIGILSGESVPFVATLDRMMGMSVWSYSDYVDGQLHWAVLMDEGACFDYILLRVRKWRESSQGHES